MGRLRRRFVVLNIAIIGTVTVVVAIVIFFGTPVQMQAGRLIGTLLITLGLIFFGSMLSSGIAMKPIRSSWQRQLDFTADASHELRTPLAVIQSNLELVLDNPSETVGSQSKWLGNIHIETLRMAKLVDDLLTLSRGDAGGQTLNYSSFSLYSVAAETAALYETAARQKGIDIHVRGAADSESADGRSAYSGSVDGEILIKADITRIRQLFGILVDNAVKYSDKPGRIDIDFDVSKNDNTVQIEVTDTGTGIAREHLDKIFGRFYRAGKQAGAPVDRQASDGFGLGLSIAELILKEHGGSIRVDSVVGEGTRFYIKLPVHNKLA